MWGTYLILRTLFTSLEGVLGGYLQREFNFYIPGFGIISLLFLIFLNPLYFGNKTFQSGDIFANKAMKSYVEKDRDGYALWNPLIFCGMPAYATERFARCISRFGCHVFLEN